MLVLLPPSESKAAPPRRGRPVDLDRLSFPELTGVRSQVLAALIEVSARPDALALLGVGGSVAEEVAGNLSVTSAPTRPAHDLYTGVLYDALGWASLNPAARRRAASRVLIASALWGWLRPGDRVPAYRLPMGSQLGLGPLARLWREPAVLVLERAAGRRGVIVDCRSGPYRTAAPIPRDLLRRTVAVRVLREQAGRTSVVSHLAKLTRGEVTRHLLELDADPRTPQALATALRARWPVELTAPTGNTQPWSLEVVLRDGS